MAQSDGLTGAADMSDAGKRGGHGERRDSTSEAARVIILVLIAAQSSVGRRNTGGLDLGCQDERPNQVVR